MHHKENNFIYVSFVCCDSFDRLWSKFHHCLKHDLTLAPVTSAKWKLLEHFVIHFLIFYPGDSGKASKCYLCSDERWPCCAGVCQQQMFCSTWESWWGVFRHHGSQVCWCRSTRLAKGMLKKKTNLTIKHEINYAYYHWWQSIIT